MDVILLGFFGKKQLVYGYNVTIHELFLPKNPNSITTCTTNFNAIIETTYFYRVTIPEAAYVLFASLTS